MADLISANLVATSAIAPKHIFGISSNWRNHVHFLNDQKVLYPAGHNLVVYNTDEKQQSYISGIEGYRSFTTLAVSPLKKYIAFAEKGEKPAIFIYEAIRLAKKKQFVFQDAEFTDITAIAFIPGQENKTLVCVTGAPDLRLYCIQWSSNKILSSIKLGCEGPVNEIVFNKKEPKFITVIGPQTFRSYELNEGQLSLSQAQIYGLREDSSRVFTTHTALNDGRLVVCSQKGEIMLVNSDGGFITFLNDSTTNNWHIESIIPFSKGFIVGGDGLTVQIYEATNDETTYYVKGTTMNSKEVFDPKEARITSLSIVDNLENKILCATQNNNIYTVSLNSTAQLSDEYTFEPLTESFHYGAINSMDLCVRKPLVVTCSTDRSVRIWNFQDRTLEYCKVFLEEAFAVSIHPSGFHVLVSFSDRIKMMNIGAYNHWYEEPTQNKEYSRIKGCRVLQFSRGGQFFAAVNGSVQNNQQIHIFSAYTGESLGYPPLRGHFGRIKSLVWTKDDRYLVSCGQDGMTYVWRVSDGARLHEFNSRGPSMSSIAILDDNKTVLGVGNDKTIKKMADGFVENIDTHNIFNQLALTNSNKLLFGGASEENMGSGYIRCYKLPILGSHVSEHPAHDDQGVTALKVTADDHYLVSAGKDGILAVFEIKDKEARSVKLRDGFAHMADEFLITKKDVDELKSHYEALKAKMNEKKNETQPPILAEKEDLIKQLKEKQRALLENEQLKYNNLENTLKETEQKYFDYIEAKKKEYEKEIGDLESHYHDITIKKVSVIEEQKDNQEKARERYRKDISEMIKDHNNKIRGTEDEYAHMIEDEVAQKNSVIEDRQRIQREHEEMVTQIMDEIDKEIENLDKKNENEIKNIMDKGLKAKGDVSITKRKYEQLRKDEVDLLEKEKEYLISKEELELERQNLKDILEKQKTIINAKDDIISEKEKRIYELKKRTQELEKFKAVLDFKIKELKKDIGPREEEIARMKALTNEMDVNLKKLSTINNTLGLVVDELDHKQSELQTHIKNQRNTLARQISKLKTIKNHIQKTVEFILDYDDLKAHVIEMKETYANTVTKTVEIDQDILNEYLAQRKYLEKSVDMLKQNLNKDQVIHKQDNFRIMKENVQLIKQINILRQEIKDIQSGVKSPDGKTKTPTKTVKEAAAANNVLSDDILLSLAEKKKIIEHQKHQLKQLKEKLHDASQQGPIGA